MISQFSNRLCFAIFICSCLLSSAFFWQSASAQETKDEYDKSIFPTLDQFNPKSQLKVQSTDLTTAKFPAIDVHTHLDFKLTRSTLKLADFVKRMDENNIAICISLDAELGVETDHLDSLNEFPDRFIAFAHINFRGEGNDDDPATWACNQPGFVRNVVEQLKRAKENGVRGVKFFKRFGLDFRDAKGQLIRIDDEQWDPIWETCGELGLPILIHSGDPAAFFDPIDNNNERLEELARHKDWSFHGEDFPSRQQILDARNAVIERHPQTIFIGAHVAGNPEDLETVGRWLDKYPNLYLELASRIAELGRQPVTAKKFFEKYQDRILFGTDGPWESTRLKLYWRFLETEDEYFPYSETQPPPQGFWRIYGLGLSDDILKKVYYANIMKLVDPTGEQYKLAAGSINASTKPHGTTDESAKPKPWIESLAFEEPPITNDAITFGILMLMLGLIFWTSSSDFGPFKLFYKVVPMLLVCYFLPSLLTFFNLVDHENKNLYFVATRYLLPATLVLLTLSIDMKEILRLGPKALIMFLTGTFGVVFGGPIAVLIVAYVYPDVIGVDGPAAVWRGLSTVAGSWIGGGANQAAMQVVFMTPAADATPELKTNLNELYSVMVAVDVFVAEIWMVFLLLGVGKTKSIDRWLKADASSIERLQTKMEAFSLSVARIPSATDLMVMAAIGFGATAFAHWGGGEISG
jgi:predicted TIM-barrel fold metal-dependent hydrolase